MFALVSTVLGIVAGTVAGLPKQAAASTGAAVSDTLQEGTRPLAEAAAKATDEAARTVRFFAALLAGIVVVFLLAPVIAPAFVLTFGRSGNIKAWFGGLSKVFAAVLAPVIGLVSALLKSIIGVVL
jgi:hypothetical protein